MKYGQKIKITVSAIALLAGGAVQAQDSGFSIGIDNEVVAGDPELAAMDVSPVSDQAKWRYVGLIDFTLGKEFSTSSDSNSGTQASYFNSGRVAVFVDGVTDTGVSITASADTGEDELSNLFRNWDEKDAEGLLRRIDPDDQYPVYGDDSTIEDLTPTDGKFYLKASKGENFLIWGNTKTRLDGSHYLGNERALYGLSLHGESDAKTSTGDAQASITGYASQPDRLPQRDVLRGTGGSLYFTRRQDISVGSETVSIVRRDAVTGRVLSFERLDPGADYDMNYIQGSVVLNRPLVGSEQSGNVVVSQSGDDVTVDLVIQYEYTPTSSDVDGMSYGARAEGYITDTVRIGATRTVENTGLAQQTADAIDMHATIGENSYVAVEAARTRGPGLGSSFSQDGGLVVDDVLTAGTENVEGRAVRADVQVDLADLGSKMEGDIRAYLEDRTAGFSTLNDEVAADEQMSGVAVTLAPAEGQTLRLAYDDYASDTGAKNQRISGSYEAQVSDTVAVAVGLEQRNTTSETGAETQQTDAALRVTYAPTEDVSVYGFAQDTVRTSGDVSNNQRYGIGGSYVIGANTTVSGEVSDGTAGVGGRVNVTYATEGGDTYYAGYEVDPAKNGGGQDGSGIVILGAKTQINERTSTFAESRFDVVGTERETSNAFGAEYSPADGWVLGATVQQGRVTSDAGDFDRNTVSLSVSYNQGDALSARLLGEFRQDRGILSGSNQDADMMLIAADVSYRLSESTRLLASASHAKTTVPASNTSLPESEYTKASIGFAYRPVENDKLNLLARYTYFDDQQGQVINGTGQQSDRQKSQVFSIDANYQLDANWMIGGKIGYRMGETAVSGSDMFTDNEAMLVIGNVRYTVMNQWDLLAEYRVLDSKSTQTRDEGALVAVYRHLGDNAKLGVGYNFSTFSDDLLDTTKDDEGIFLNLVAKF